MAAGASSPELFSSFVSLFITHSSLGLGTVSIAVDVDGGRSGIWNNKEVPYYDPLTYSLSLFFSSDCGVGDFQSARYLRGISLRLYVRTFFVMMCRLVKEKYWVLLHYRTSHYIPIISPRRPSLKKQYYSQDWNASTRQSYCGPWSWILCLGNYSIVYCTSGCATCTGRSNGSGSYLCFVLGSLHGV